MFRNLILLIRALRAVLLFGPFYKVPEKVKNILIMQPAKLGDMVCTTPIFRAIKNHFPESRVVVVGDNTNRELLANHPDVDEYVLMDRNNTDKIIEKISSLNIDFACIPAPSFYGLAVLMMSGVGFISSPNVVGGWSPHQTISYRILSLFTKTVEHQFGAYAPREYLKLLSPLGIFSNNTKKFLSYSESAHIAFDKIRRDIKTKYIVGISPSSGNKIKNWPIERFVEWARYAIDNYDLTIIVFGSSRDTEEVNEFMSHFITEPRVISTAELINMDELKYFISKLDFFISVDTGLIYVAEAFGVPTIDIVGPVAELEQPPISNINRVVVPHRDEPAMHIMNARVYDRDEARRQVLDIGSDKVIIITDSLFKDIGINKIHA